MISARVILSCFSSANVVDLVEPSEPWDRKYAHKPWVIKHGGIVYHYYCAVGNSGRVIALATSKDLGESPLNGNNDQK